MSAISERVRAKAREGSQAVDEKQPAPAANDSTVEAEKTGTIMAYWPDACSAMPTEFTRAALFGLPRRGRRKIMKSEKLESRPDIEIYYTGDQLDQSDADLWLACLRAGRGIALGQRIYTTRSALLKSLRKTDGRANYTWLAGSLDRMSEASLRIVVKRNSEFLRLKTGMLKWVIEENSGRMYFRLDPDSNMLFDNLSFSDWDLRLSLKTNIAKSFQLYVSGHKSGESQSVDLKKLMSWSGYVGRVRQYRAELLLAMSELEAAGLITQPAITLKHCGEVASWLRTENKKTTN